MSKLVSVIITTKNSELTLSSCLKSIKNQTYKKIEIIVVDNNSLDQTKNIALSFTKNVFNKGGERSIQRNFGAKKAKGEILLFLDSDQELSNNVIKNTAKKFNEIKTLAGIYYPEIIIGNNLWAKIRTFERSFYNQTPIDAVRSVTKSTFNKIGGFDINLTGPEDWDFDKRVRHLGETVLLNDNIFHNEKNLSIKTYIHKKIYYSKDFDKYIKKWGKNDSDIKKQFGLIYRMFWVFIENDKWKKIFRYPVLTLATIFIKLLLGISYFVNLYFGKK